ncbi:hypothetical protein J1614_003198, partial [Plenodomus biglobosus]
MRGSREKQWRYGPHVKSLHSTRLFCIIQVVVHIRLPLIQPHSSEAYSSMMQNGSNCLPDEPH